MKPSPIEWEAFDPELLDQVEARPGDILGVAGPGWVSRRIRKATTDRDEEPSLASHVDLVVGRGRLPDVRIVGAAEGRVRSTTPAAAYGGERPSGLVVMRPLNLPPEDLEAIVEAVLDRESQGERYGYGDIALHYLDRLTGWKVFRRMVTWRRPICSVLLAAEYQLRGYSFGVPVGFAAPDDIDDFARANPSKYCWPFGSDYRVLPRG